MRHPGLVVSSPYPRFGIDDVDLVRRAVMFCGQAMATPAGAGGVPRWMVVRELFQVGGHCAMQLCRRFGMDPDELLPARPPDPPG